MREIGNKTHNQRCPFAFLDRVRAEYFLTLFTFGGVQSPVLAILKLDKLHQQGVDEYCGLLLQKETNYYQPFSFTSFLCTGTSGAVHDLINKFKIILASMKKGWNDAQPI